MACVTELGFRPTDGSQLSFGQGFLTEPMASRVGLRPRAHAGIWRTADFLTACSRVCCPKPLPLVLGLGLCPGRSQPHGPITSRPHTGPWAQGPRPLLQPHITQASSWQCTGGMVFLGQH